MRNRTSLAAFMTAAAITSLAVLPAVAQIAVTKTASIVNINGTVANDIVVVNALSATTLRVRANGQNIDLSCPTAGPSAPMIMFIGRGGDDNFVNNTTLDATAFGGAGNDRLVATGGMAVYFGGGGSDCIVGGTLSDTLDGGPGDDEIFGGGGADELTGSGGADVIVGGPGADRISGGLGADEIFGGEGADDIEFDLAIASISLSVDQAMTSLTEEPAAMN